MKAVKKALDTSDDNNPVFYVDEVDIDLNPRIGNCWSIKGKQKANPTPGKISNVIYVAHCMQKQAIFSGLNGKRKIPIYFY